MSKTILTDEFVSRFWSNVKMSSLFDCWTWQRAKTKAGYGVTTNKRKLFYAHRLSWEINFGEIPKDLCVLHKCDNPPCVNPAHLFIGTRADNAKDKIEKGRQPRGENVGGSILDKGDVLQIRKLRREGWKVKRIAAHFNVKPKHIEQIIYRQSWRHI